MILRRRSRAEQLAAEVKDVSPVQRAAVVALAVAGLLALTYIGRRRLFQAIAVLADVVEEAADTVEDAAEDVRDFARERAGAT
jgi:hypothetical protein